MIVNDSVPQSVFSDAKRIKQILFNLIGNAIKFTFKGKIAVSATYNQSNMTSLISSKIRGLICSMYLSISNIDVDI